MPAALGANIGNGTGSHKLNRGPSVECATDASHRTAENLDERRRPDDFRITPHGVRYPQPTRGEPAGVNHGRGKRSAGRLHLNLHSGCAPTLTARTFAPSRGRALCHFFRRVACLRGRTTRSRIRFCCASQVARTEILLIHHNHYRRRPKPRRTLQEGPRKPSPGRNNLANAVASAALRDPLTGALRVHCKSVLP